MSKSFKVIYFSLAGLLGLLAVAAVALLLFLDPDAYKPKLEAAATEALGMEVRSRLPVWISVWNRPCSVTRPKCAPAPSPHAAASTCPCSPWAPSRPR